MAVLLNYVSLILILVGVLCNKKQCGDESYFSSSGSTSLFSGVEAVPLFGSRKNTNNDEKNNMIKKEKGTKG